MKSSNLVAACLSVATFCAVSPSFAQSSPFATSTAGSNDWASSSTDKNAYQARGNARNLGLGLSLGAFIVGGRWEIENGGLLSVDVVWRRALGRNNLDRGSRIEIGGLGRIGFTPEAVLLSAGVPFRLVLGMHPRWETDFDLELSYTRISFAQTFFPPRNGFLGTLRYELSYYVDPKVSIGMAPISFSLVAGEGVDAFVAYEPCAFVRFSPI